MATCLISWSTADATSKWRNVSSENCGSGLQYVPRVIITDKLKSYGAAKREILPGVEHRQHARIEQSSRKFASTHAIARKENASVQISPHRRNAFSLLIAPHRWAFPTATSLFECTGIPRHVTGPIPDVE